MSFEVYVIAYRPGLQDWAAKQMFTAENIEMPTAVRCKIGFSGRPKTRLSVLASSEKLKSCELRLEKTIRCVNRRSAFLLEQALHLAFAMKRIGKSEWFNLSAKEIEGFDDLATQLGCPIGKKPAR